MTSYLKYRMIFKGNLSEKVNYTLYNRCFASQQINITLDFFFLFLLLSSTVELIKYIIGLKANHSIFPPEKPCTIICQCYSLMCS